MNIIAPTVKRAIIVASAPWYARDAITDISMRIVVPNALDAMTAARAYSSARSAKYLITFMRNVRFAVTVL